MSGITADHIEAALRSVPYAYGGQNWSMDTLARGANDAAAAAGITTAKGAAVLVAQCMVESAYFRTTEEYGGSNTRYAPYYGRGFIQLTWRSNYAGMGRWAKDCGLVSNSNAFVNNPDLLADEKWAWMVAVFYMSSNDLIGLANAGNNYRVGMGIHAGDAYADQRGYPWSDVGRNRVKHTSAAYDALVRAGVGAPSGSSSSGKNLPGGKLGNKDIQELVGVTVDGDYGPSTTAAVRELQQALDLTADGAWGPATEEAVMSLLDEIRDVKRIVKNIETDNDAVNRRTRNMETELDLIERLVKNIEKDNDQVRVGNHRALVDEIRKTPDRVWNERLDTPGSVLKQYPWMNKTYSAKGLVAYNLFSFASKDDHDEILAAIKAEQDEA